MLLKDLQNLLFGGICQSLVRIRLHMHTILNGGLCKFGRIQKGRPVGIGNATEKVGKLGGFPVFVGDAGLGTQNCDVLMQMNVVLRYPCIPDLSSG